MKIMSKIKRNQKGSKKEQHVDEKLQLLLLHQQCLKMNIWMKIVMIVKIMMMIMMMKIRISRQQNVVQDRAPGLEI